MAEEKSAAIDGAGIYALANKPTTALQSPFEALQQAGQAAQVVNANRLFRAGLARGQIMQQAIDPATGQYSPSQANKLFAGSTDSDVPLVAPQAVGQNQELQGAQQGQALQRFQWAAGAVGSLMADNDGAGPSWDRVKQTLAAGLQGGYLQPSDVHSMVISMPKDDSPASLAARRQVIAGINEQLQSAQQRLMNVTGTPGEISNGQDLQPVVRGGALTSRFGVPMAAGPAIPQYPSRSELLNQQPGVDPATGEETRVPLGARAGQQGAGALTGPAGAALTPRGRPSALFPPGYTGAYAPPAAATGGAVPVGLPPGEAESQRVTREAGAQQGVVLQREATEASPQRQTILNNMLTDLGKFTPGPGSARETYAQSLLQRVAPETMKAMGLDPQRVASAESFDKLANQIAMAQAGAMGAGTDQKLLTSMHANPNSGLSKMGVQQIIATLQGNEDAIQAKNKAWQEWIGSGKSPSTYAQFSTQFSQRVDPRVFQFTRMAPADRRSYAESLPDQDAFKQKYRDAVKSGLIPDPRKAAANGG